MIFFKLYHWSFATYFTDRTNSLHLKTFHFWDLSSICTGGTLSTCSLFSASISSKVHHRVRKMHKHVNQYNNIQSSSFLKSNFRCWKLITRKWLKSRFVEPRPLFLTLECKQMLGFLNNIIGIIGKFFYSAWSKSKENNFDFGPK